MKTDEQLRCKDCDWFRTCEYYSRRKETSQICKMFNNTWKFVAELEKIKAEIDGLYSDCLYGEQLVSKPETMQIIDNHIKELKGENNE